MTGGQEAYGPVELSGYRIVPPSLHQRSLRAGMTDCPRRMAWAAKQGSPERPELSDTYHACRERQPDTLQGHLVLKCSLAEILLPSVAHSRATQNTPKLQCWSLQCSLVNWVSLATRSPLPLFPPHASSPFLPLSSSLSSCPILTPPSFLSPQFSG